MFVIHERKLSYIFHVSYWNQGGCRGGTLILQPPPPTPSPYLTITDTLFGKGLEEKYVELDDIQFQLVF